MLLFQVRYWFQNAQRSVWHARRRLFFPRQQLPFFVEKQPKVPVLFLPEPKSRLADFANHDKPFQNMPVLKNTSTEFFIFIFANCKYKAFIRSLNPLKASVSK